MDKGQYDRTVTLLCPTCGNTEMEHDSDLSDGGTIKCPSCNRVMTKEELIRENGENIEYNVEEIKEEVIKDVEKMLADAFKKGFSGSKNIRIK